MPPYALANTVSAFATTLAGLLALIFAILRPQPRRWQIVYFCILLTGLATIWYHGTDEKVFLARLADIGTNLLVAWVIQVAVLQDYYSKRVGWIVAAASGFSCLAYLIWMVVVGPDRSRSFPLSFGDFGGFSLGELTLIGNVLLGVGLLVAKLKCIRPAARPLVYLMIGWWLMGTVLASGSNKQIDAVYFAWHALWHIEGALGFIILWYMNEVRLKEAI